MKNTKKTVIFGILIVILMFSFVLTGCSGKNNKIILPNESYEEEVGDNNKIIHESQTENYGFQTNITQNKKFPSIGDKVIIGIQVFCEEELNNINYLLKSYKETDKSTIFVGNATSNSTTNLTFTFIPETSGSYIFEIYAFNEKIGDKTIIVLKNTYKEYTGSIYELPDINCTDYDGKDFYKKTSCFDKYNPNGITDYCMGSDWVVDYGCSDDACIVRKYKCPNGCLHGACIRVN